MSGDTSPNPNSHRGPGGVRPLRNVLFIMADQFRADFLSCYGAKHAVDTPNIDRLAAKGVRFERAYVQSAVCGPSRMSFYTGRYPGSHGASWNFVPVLPGEHFLGDYLRDAGREVHLCGKTHAASNELQLRQLGIEVDGAASEWLREAGFRVVARHEGDLPVPRPYYEEFLKDRGYAGEHRWRDWANSAEGPNGELLDGMAMRHAHLPARVREEDSETAYVTDQAIGFIELARDRPWVLHVSYIKPHWPYIAPRPYHAMYRGTDVGVPKRSAIEERTLHPVVAAYRTHLESVNWSRPEVVEHVRPTYKGLIKQIDDHVGRLLSALERSGAADETLVIFTADHGDHLGDHGLGEKELFYEQSVRVPFLLVDPRAAHSRGRVERQFAQAVDVVPTILDALGLPEAPHRLEGRSLLNAARGQAIPDSCDQAVCELDYSFRPARKALGLSVRDCFGTMIRTDRWKFVEWNGFRPQLFDLEEDPDEFRDLAHGNLHRRVVREMRERLAAWRSSLKRRTAYSDAEAESKWNPAAKAGVEIGLW